MSRIRGWLTLACAASLVVACSKSGGGSGTGAAGAGSGATPPAAQAGPLDLIPKDATAVVGVSWSKFKGTKFYNMMMANLPASAKTDFDAMKQACGIDAMTALDSITVGVVGNLDKTARVVLIAKGDWTRDKIKQCAPAIAEKKGKKLTITDEGDITSYAIEGEKTVNIGWSGDLAVITPQSAEGDKTYLSDILKKASSVKDNKPLSDLLAKTNSSGTLYGALLPAPGSDAAAQMNKMTNGTEKLIGAYGTIKLASDLDVNFGMRFATDAEAKSVADRLSKELDTAKQSPQGGPFLSKAAVKAEATDTVFTLALDEKQLDQLTEMLKQVAPMMLPMMLGAGAGDQ
jgi:hypothetical protein